MSNLLFVLFTLSQDHHHCRRQPHASWKSQGSNVASSAVGNADSRVFFFLRACVCVCACACVQVHIFFPFANCVLRSLLSSSLSVFDCLTPSPLSPVSSTVARVYCILLSPLPLFLATRHVCAHVRMPAVFTRRKGRGVSSAFLPSSLLPFPLSPLLSMLIRGTPPSLTSPRTLTPAPSFLSLLTCIPQSSPGRSTSSPFPPLVCIFFSTTVVVHIADVAELPAFLFSFSQLPLKPRIHHGFRHADGT